MTIYEHGSVMIRDQVAKSRISSFALGLKSGLLFLPARLWVEMLPAGRVFLSASGFFLISLFHVFSTSAGILLAGCYGLLEPSDRGDFVTGHSELEQGEAK